MRPLSRLQTLLRREAQDGWRSTFATVVDRMEGRSAAAVLVLDVDPVDGCEGFRATTIAAPCVGVPLPALGDKVSVEARFGQRRVRLITGPVHHRFLLGMPEWSPGIA
jgi:hypothetical protein